MIWTKNLNLKAKKNLKVKISKYRLKEALKLDAWFL